MRDIVNKDAGVIGKLAYNRARLVLQKQKLEENYRKQNQEIQLQIDNIDNAIKVVNDALGPYLCPNCKGTGIKRICDCAGDMEDEVCPNCKGTGIKTT